MKRRVSFTSIPALWIALLFILGFSVRVYQLGALPSILNRDEAALAYNAHLLRETGKDEWGVTWPLFLQSFGDYKLIGYPAALVAFFSIFGESDLVVRLPSVLAGTILLWLGLKAIEVFIPNSQAESQRSTEKMYVLLTLAVTPVFFFFSRIAFEAMVALMLFLAGVLLLFKKSSSQKLDMLSAGLLLLACITYNTPLLLLPFLILFLPIWRGWKRYQDWFATELVLIGIFVGIFWALLPVAAQKGGITIFSDEHMRYLFIEHRNNNQGVFRYITNTWLYFYGKQILSAAVQSFMPKFLLFQGGAHPWHSLPGWGHLLLPTYLLSLLGLSEIARVLKKNVMSIVGLLQQGKPLRTQSFASHASLLYLLLVSLLPSVITVDAPHTTRSLFFLFLLCVISVLGMRLMLSKTPKLFAVTVVSIALFSGVYLSSYFYSYPKQQTAIFQSGFDRVVRKVATQHPNEKIAIVDDSGDSYVLVAWYLKMSATEFFATVVKQLPDGINFRYGERVGNFHFIAQKTDRASDETVLIYFDQNAWRVEE